MPRDRLKMEVGEGLSAEGSIEDKPDGNRMLFQRDLAIRQLKITQANMKIVQMALNENRPLEALRTLNNGVEELDEAIEAFEEMEVPAEADEQGKDDEESTGEVQ